MSVPCKSGMALLIGMMLAANCFQGMILAADSAEKSHALYARITRAQAEKVALVRVPGKLKGAKLEHENGRLIWSVDIITPLTKKVGSPS